MTDASPKQFANTALTLVALGVLAVMVPPNEASAKRLDKCTYHARGGMFPTPPEMAPGSDGKSVKFYPGQRRDAPPEPPGTVKKLRCVVHLDCEIPKNVRNVEFRYEGVKEDVNRSPFQLRGMEKRPVRIRLVRSWVERGFAVQFKDAADAVIKTCKIVLITDR